MQNQLTILPAQQYGIKSEAMLKKKKKKKNLNRLYSNSTFREIKKPTTLIDILIGFWWVQSSIIGMVGCGWYDRGIQGRPPF